VKFLTVLGVHALAWDKAKDAGKDADFHRRDLWEAIDKGQYPEFEFECNCAGGG
jgi:catalase